MSTYTYIVQCADGTLYTGWTTDVQARLEAHNAGKGAKYTRTRLPVKLRACWEFSTKSEAMKHEWHIKSLTRREKLALISSAPQPPSTGQTL